MFGDPPLQVVGVITERNVVPAGKLHETLNWQAAQTGGSPQSVSWRRA